MSFGFETERFHIETGPESLFRRVRHVMEKTELKLHAEHFQQRAEERDAPVEQLRKFDPADWELLIAEVRRDTGKFVSSGWLRDVEGQGWLVVIGLKDTVVTAYPSGGGKLGDEIVRGGMLYELVSSVNQKLMEEEQ
jgi:hypothetical protein